MKDMISETMTVEGYASNLYREVVTICGVRCKFENAEFENGKTRIYVASTNPIEFSFGKGKYLRRKIRQYLRWTARQNEAVGYDPYSDTTADGRSLPTIRKEWH